MDTLVLDMVSGDHERATEANSWAALEFVTVAEALLKLISDSNRRVIYQFAMDRPTVNNLISGSS